MKLIPVPTKYFLFLLAIPIVLILVQLFAPISKKVFYIVDFLILIFAIWDLMQAYENRHFSIKIEKKSSFYMNQWNNLSLSISSENIRGFIGQFSLDLPQYWQSKEDICKKPIKPNSIQHFDIALLAKRRGLFKIERIHLRFLSPASLFYLYNKSEVQVEISVFPDYRELKEYFLLSKNNRLYEMGIHKNRYKGQGTELESLREYTEDDDARHIDWKATARLNKPVTKVFQMESVNDVVFVLDCGRLMTSEEKKLSSVDLAIQALLVLSHITISMGDRIRIVAFSDRIIGDFNAPRKGNVMNRILNFVTPIQAEFVESNYSLLFSNLQTTIKKRSLIILVSDLIDDINYPLFKDNLSILRKRNAILFLLLRDCLLQEHADKESDSLEDIYSITAARSMFINRSKAIYKLKQQGIVVLDLLPEEVTAKLIDKYMQIKASNKV